MAYWHYNCLVLPKDEIWRVFPQKPFALSQDQIEAHQWWSEVQPPKDLEKEISKILPRDKSWSPEVGIWGGDDGDTITVVYDCGKIQEIELKIDTRDLSQVFLIKILELVRLLDGIIYTWDHHLIEPNAEIFFKEIGQFSTELKQDPEGVIIKRGHRYQG